jgi:hypothetical protein
MDEAERAGCARESSVAFLDGLGRFASILCPAHSSNGLFPGAASTQYFADISDRENGEKLHNVRTKSKLSQLAFVELNHIVLRYIRFLGKELDGRLLMGFLLVLSVHRSVHS